MGVNLHAVEQALLGIHARVRQRRLDLLGKGAAVKVSGGKASDEAFWASLAADADRLRRLVATLDGRLSALAHERDVMAWAVPRELRWRFRQSVRDREASARDLRDLALAILAELTDLEGGAGKPTERDLVEAAEKLLKQLGETVDKLSLEATVVQGAGKGPVVGPPGHAPAPGGGVASLAGLVALLIALIRARARGRKGMV